MATRGLFGSLTNTLNNQESSTEERHHRCNTRSESRAYESDVRRQRNE